MQKWIKNGLLLALLCVLPGGMADAEAVKKLYAKVHIEVMREPVMEG